MAGADDPGGIDLAKADAAGDPGRRHADVAEGFGPQGAVDILEEPQGDVTGVVKDREAVDAGEGFPVGPTRGEGILTDRPRDQDDMERCGAVGPGLDVAPPGALGVDEILEGLQGNERSIAVADDRHWSVGLHL